MRIGDEQSRVENARAWRSLRVPAWRPLDDTGFDGYTHAVAVLRLAYIVALLALLGQATGFSAYASAASPSHCTQPCPDDDDEGTCPPNCTFCICCAHMPPITVVRTGLLVRVPATPVQFHVTESIPSSAEPADILHVPKLLLA